MLLHTIAVLQRVSSLLWIAFTVGFDRAFWLCFVAFEFPFVIRDQALSPAFCSFVVCFNIVGPKSLMFAANTGYSDPCGLPCNPN